MVLTPDCAGCNYILPRGEPGPDAHLQRPEERRDLGRPWPRHREGPRRGRRGRRQGPGLRVVVIMIVMIMLVMIVMIMFILCVDDSSSYYYYYY